MGVIPAAQINAVGIHAVDKIQPLIGQAEVVSNSIPKRSCLVGLGVIRCQQRIFVDEIDCPSEAIFPLVGMSGICVRWIVLLWANREIRSRNPVLRFVGGNVFQRTYRAENP